MKHTPDLPQMPPPPPAMPAVPRGPVMFLNVRDADLKLLEMINSIEAEASGWRALHFRFSRLLEHYRSESQLKIAVNLVHDLLKQLQGGVFLSADSDLFVLCKNVTKPQLEKVIFQVRYLFSEDPLSYTSEGQENPDFCKIYDLSIAWGELQALVKRRMTTRNRKPSAAGAAGGGKITRLSAQHLAGIERDLANADLSRVLRRQPVCAAVPGMMIRKVFDELYIHIAHLRQFLRSEVDLLSNRWLFKYLTQLLDDRMLGMLKHHPARYFESPASLNLNVQTLLSAAFADFDAAIKPATKVSIVIEIQVADVFADMGAFMTAKESVQKLGYRVCLDGLTTLSFTQIDRERLGFDLAKLQWNADMESDAGSSENKRLADAIRHCGANRVILCRCDSRQAIEYGQALGISLFQGRYLDSMMNPTQKIEN